MTTYFGLSTPNHHQANKPKPIAFLPVIIFGIDTISEVRI
jgi:hypothetical protein